MREAPRGEERLKLQILSDLHVGFHPLVSYDRFLRSIRVQGIDALILAGDVVELKPRDRRWAIERLKEITAHAPKAYYVLGNHEFYGTSIASVLADVRELEAEVPGLVILDNRGVYYGTEDRNILGGTLFQPKPPKDDPARMHPITDHRAIRDFPREAPRQYRAMLERLDLVASNGDVVITHHAPSNRSLAPDYEGEPSNRWFITPEVEPLLLERKPALWVHGHTHTPFDYVLGETRVICNPRGYPGEGKGFRPDLVVEI